MTEETKNITRGNLLFHMGYLTRRWRQILDGEFFSCGLTDATWRPILHLDHLGDGIRQKDLAASIGIEGPTLVRLLEKLIAKGLINRTEDASDRRAKLLSLSDEGRALVLRIRERVQALESELLAPFSDEELELLAGLVERLDASVSSTRRKGK